jgi:hypothetical protein
MVFTVSLGGSDVSNVQKSALAVALSASYGVPIGDIKFLPSPNSSTVTFTFEGPSALQASNSLSAASAPELSGLGISSIQSAPPSSPAAPSDSSSSNVGMIVGIVVGSIVGVALIAGVAYMALKPKRRTFDDGSSKSNLNDFEAHLQKSERGGDIQ